MKTNHKKLVITAGSVFLLAACSWNPFSREEPTPNPTPTSTQVSQEELNTIRQELEQKTGIVIPTAQPTTEPAPTESEPGSEEPSESTQLARQEIALKSNAGQAATGYVNREYNQSNFTINLLADLPEPQAGEFYNLWIAQGQSGDENYSLMSLGRINSVKGGYVLEYQSTENLRDYNQVIISKETQADENIEQMILTGSFSN